MQINDTASALDQTADTKLSCYDWADLFARLDRQGWAMLEGLLLPDECARIAALYDEEALYRKQVIMERHGYGRGAYRYFAYPLPDWVVELRAAVYARLAPLANSWHERLGQATRYPERHATYLAECHAAGQLRPTPLLLKYGAEDFNCLHQDLYGELMFPMQMAVLLNEPGRDFSGGEFVLTEQRVRMQSRVEVVPLRQGDAVIFAVRERPAKGLRGTHRLIMRHGVSTVRAGHRQTLGIILHDAK